MRRLAYGTLLCTAAMLLFPAQSQAQGYVVSLQASDSVAIQALRKFSHRKFADSLQVVAALEQLTSSLRVEGYLLAEVAQLEWKGDSVSGKLTAGRKQYLLLRKEEGSLMASTWAELKTRESLKKELAIYLNTGYPFARMHFDEVGVSHDTLFATLSVEKGPKIVFDSLTLSKNTRTKPRFLQQYLFVTTGSEYSEKAVEGIVSRINSSGYLRTSTVPGVEFYAGKARLDIKLEELPVNQIDGVIGFLPDQNAETGKLLLTGQVETDLHNLFGSGKHIYLNWQSFNVASQKLDLAYDHPVILGSPLDFNGSFQQLKQDSAFVTRTAHAGFLLPIAYYWKFGFGVDFRQNSLLTTSRSTAADQLTNADSRLNQFGISLAYARLDDILLPTSGMSTGLKVGAGQKQITKNSAVDPAKYDGINLKSTQTTFEGYLENYIKAGKSTVFAQQAYVGGIVNKQIFQNDLFRIGGLRRLRGFNENQFFSRHYGVGVTELRFMFQEQSYLVAFADQGLLSDVEGNWSYAVGIGGGMVLKVNNGIFRLMLAAGATRNQPFDLTQPKVHFGFVNRF